ncbi:MAG: RNA methyltransferase [Parvularculaceae bacterium]|nr:RNA methyltransferase [Parvularculaceae bacterium]
MKHRKKPGGETRARPPAKGRRGQSSGGPSTLWIYGRHAAAAALANPARRVKRGFATKNAADWLRETGLAPEKLALLEDARPDAIDRLLHAGAVHQGLAIETFELERARLKDVCAPDGVRRPVVVLDQIADPQNIGAILRTAAAFGARAAIVQERRTPPLSGALAKAAAGALETLPVVKAVNISRALEALKELGYFCAGLAGEGAAAINDLPKEKPVAIVLGAEGAGLRRLVGDTCDGLFKIPIDPVMESLNVSNAAAISLYEATRGQIA